MNVEARAPGWQIRCLKCDFTEPWGKYGVRLAGAGRSFTVGRCPKCNRIRFHVIEKVPKAKFSKGIGTLKKLAAIKLVNRVAAERLPISGAD